MLKNSVKIRFEICWPSLKGFLGRTWARLNVFIHKKIKMYSKAQINSRDTFLGSNISHKKSYNHIILKLYLYFVHTVGEKESALPVGSLTKSWLQVAWPRVVVFDIKKKWISFEKLDIFHELRSRLLRSL